MALHVDNSQPAKVSRPDPDSLRFKAGALTEALLALAGTGKGVVFGTTTLTATLSIVSGLTTIEGFCLTPLGGSAPTAGLYLNGARKATTQGTLLAKRWKATGATTTTPVAATAAGSISYAIWGTL